MWLEILREDQPKGTYMSQSTLLHTTGVLQHSSHSLFPVYLTLFILLWWLVSQETVYWLNRFFWHIFTWLNIEALFRCKVSCSVGQISRFCKIHWFFKAVGCNKPSRTPIRTFLFFLLNHCIYFWILQQPRLIQQNSLFVKNLNVGYFFHLIGLYSCVDPIGFVQHFPCRLQCLLKR